MESGYKSLRSKKRTRQKTNYRAKRGRPLNSKNRSTIEKELKAEIAQLPNGKLAVEEMDVEIARFEKLQEVLYPWGEDGKLIEGKTEQAYYWASEMRRDYVQMRAPYQSPRLSSVQVVPAGQSKRNTTVNVTILNERGEQEYTDVTPDSDAADAGMKLIEGVAEADNPGDNPREPSDEAA